MVEAALTWLVGVAFLVLGYVLDTGEHGWRLLLVPLLGAAVGVALEAIKYAVGLTTQEDIKS